MVVSNQMVMAGKTCHQYLLLVAVLSICGLVIGSSGSNVPTVFIFGDSTADVGNNNFLERSLAKANFPPNGIDFVKGRATGRFSNGLNSVDFIARMLGLKRSPPPFLSLNSHTLPKHAAKGINFASGASGILDATGTGFVDYISLWQQLQNFATARTMIVDRIGVAATEELLSKSIFFISVGSNDLFDHFNANGPVNYTQKMAFVKTLKTTYKYQLQRLYELGARKIGIVSIPPIGCCPALRALSPSGDCIEDLNESSKMFYDAIKSMLAELSCDLNGFKYSLGNAFEMLFNFFKLAPALGFTEVKAACCGGGKFNGQALCTPNATVCSDRRSYLFWDLYHPTQAASKLAAATLFGGSSQFVTPINFAQLAQY